MAHFNRDDRSGSNRDFRKQRFNSDRPDMHKATCASCGMTCEVPFRPSGSKPVYCKECFRKNEGPDSRRSENRTFGGPDSGDRQMHEAVCANCGKTCQIPFRPSPGRDVFCSRCFENKESSGSQRPQRRNFDKPRFNRDDNRGRTNDVPNYKAQFEILNAKMDKILKLLTPAVVEVAPLESAIQEKVIDEIAQDVLEDKTQSIKKEKKEAKSLAKKQAKTRKAASSKK